MTYTYDEVFQASKEYFNGNDLAAKVFVDKYALRDNDGNYYDLIPHNMHDRLASEFARIDSERYNLDYSERYSLYRSAMDKFSRIVPQGSPMCAIGNKYQHMSASNCVVIDAPEDNIGSIFRTGESLAQLYKRRAGVGFCLSKLRPEGTAVSNAAKTTTGAWSFADFYSYVTNIIGQKSRRGALMLTMDVHHPDIIKFATCKHDETKVSGANISVKLSNEFMDAVKNNKEYEQRWPVDSKNPKISKMVDARKVWNQIIESATYTGDPGLIFWDTMCENLPAHYYDMFKTQCVNPCAEINLSGFDSCRLISINLTAYIIDPFTDNAKFDMKSFKSDIRLATHMIDNLVDLEIELIDNIKNICEDEHERDIWNKLQESGLLGRRTGLGTHGLADALAQLTIKYDSDAGVEMVKKIYKTLRNEAYSYSVELAKIRGPFPVFDWNKEKECPFIKNLPARIQNDIKMHGRRNISMLTQAPTGTVSIVSRVGNFNRFNVSSGVEPVFRTSYTRSKKINPDDEASRIDRVDKNNVSWQDFEVFHSNVLNYTEVSGKKSLPEYFITSDKIDWNKRLEIQSAEQQYIDHSISSTLNLPKGTDTETVKQIYLTAWEKQLKGVTIYVDGSKSVSVLSESDNTDNRPKTIIQSQSPKRPEKLDCDIMHGVVNGEKWTILIGLLENEPYEIFMGKADKFNLSTKETHGKIIKVKRGTYNLLDIKNNVLLEDIIKSAESDGGAWTTRMLSMSLRHGVPIEYLIDQLSKDGSIVDINNVIARLLRKYEKKRKAKKEEICPQCGSHDLQYEEGCKKCLQCGWTKCQ